MFNVHGKKISAKERNIFCANYSRFRCKYNRFIFSSIVYLRQKIKEE